MRYPIDLYPREQLEDCVAEILGEGFYDTWTDSELEAVIAKHQRQAIPAHAPAPLARARVDRLAWGEPTYYVKDGILWMKREARDKVGKAHVQNTRAPQRIAWEGRIVSAASLMRYLLTGSWNKPVKAYRAVVWDGLKTRHLGYFATREERDATVLMWKLNRPVR
jgi:hypothetical protein